MIAKNQAANGDNNGGRNNVINNENKINK